MEVKYMWNKIINLGDLYIKSFSILSICIFCISSFPNNIIFELVILVVTILSLIILMAFVYKCIKWQVKKEFNTLTLLTTLSVLVSITRVTGLYFARIFQSKPGLLWNVDNGFALSHSNTIARFGSLESSLSYAGEIEAYHAGPSYIAGIYSKYLNVDPSLLILLIIPILSFSIYVISTWLISNSLSKNKNLSCIMIISMCFLPGIFLGEMPIGTSKLIIIDPLLFTKKLFYSLPYSFNLMQNSMFAGSIIMGIIYLLINNFKKNIIFIFITALSLSSIKPLYFISTFLIIFAYLLTIILTNERNSIITNTYKFLRSKEFYLIILLGISWYFIYTNQTTPFYKLYISFRYFNVKNILDIQLWPTKIAISNISLLSSIVFFFCIFCKIKKERNALFALDFSIISHALSIIVTVISLQLPLAYKVQELNNIVLGRELGINPNEFGEYFVKEWQAAYPLAAVSILFGIYAILKSNTINIIFSLKLNNKLANLTIFFTLFLNTIHSSFLLFKPNYVKNFNEGDEVNESEYIEIINSIPVKGSTLISNTFYEGYYGRKYRNTYLTSFSKHQFYISNIIDYHWRSQKDALNRFNIYKQIFPTHSNNIGIYNPDSITIIKQENITHILLKRMKDNEFIKLNGLKLIRKNSNWAAYEVKNKDNIQIKY